jgi:hypothetical protein
MEFKVVYILFQDIYLFFNFFEKEFTAFFFQNVDGFFNIRKLVLYRIKGRYGIFKTGLLFEKIPGFIWR